MTSAADRHRHLGDWPTTPPWRAPIPYVNSPPISVDDFLAYTWRTREFFQLNWAQHWNTLRLGQSYCSRIPWHTIKDRPWSNGNWLPRRICHPWPWCIRCASRRCKGRHWALITLPSSMYALSQLFGTMWSCANDTQAAAWEGRDCNAFKFPPQPLLLLLSCHLCICLDTDPSLWHAPRNPCTLVIPSLLDYIHWTQVGSPIDAISDCNTHKWFLWQSRQWRCNLTKTLWTMHYRKLWAASLPSLDTQTQKSMFCRWRLIHWCASLCQTQY